MADYLYLIHTTSGYYLGKQSSDSHYWYLTEHHGSNSLERSWSKTTSSDNFSHSLENQWALAIRAYGMQASLTKFIKSASIQPLDPIYEKIKKSVNAKFKAEAGLPSLWDWLCQSFGVGNLEVTEALAIMLLPKANETVHNLKVDFLSPWPKNGITQKWVKETALNSLMLNREIYVNLTAWRQMTDAEKGKDPVMTSLRKALRHEKVSQVLGEVITRQISLDQGIEALSQSKAQYLQWLKTNASQISDGLSNTGYAQLNAAQRARYQEAIVNWYNKAHGVVRLWNDSINEALAPTVQNYYKRKIAMEFQTAYVASGKSEGELNMSNYMRTESIFKLWSFFNDANVWDQFYAEQMSIWYGSKFGALQLISKDQDEFGNYAFGRPGLMKGDRIRELFTSPDPNLEDRVHTFEQMTIF